MAAYKIKIVAFVIVSVLSSAAPAVQPSQSVRESSKSLFDNSDSLLTKDPNLTKTSVEPLNTHQMFFKMIVALILVIVLALAVFYASKKFGNRFINPQGKQIKIVETVYLGQRKSVHLLQIGTQRILIGSTADSITRLADLPAESSELSSAKKDNV